MDSKKDIKYGQIWTYKEDGLPVCVVAVAKDGVQIEWFGVVATMIRTLCLLRNY